MSQLLTVLSGIALKLRSTRESWQCSEPVIEEDALTSLQLEEVVRTLDPPARQRQNAIASGAQSAVEGFWGAERNEYEACNQEGNRLLLGKHYEEAIAAFERALQLKPNASYAWQQRGDALRQTKRYAEAIASYDKALEFSANPISRYQTLNARGALLLELERYEDAIAAYDRALAICPNGMGSPHILEMKGIALSKLRRYDEAGVLFDTAYAKAVEVCAKTL